MDSETTPVSHRIRKVACPLFIFLTNLEGGLTSKGEVNTPWGSCVARGGLRPSQTEWTRLRGKGTFLFIGAHRAISVRAPCKTTFSEHC